MKSRRLVALVLSAVVVAWAPQIQSAETQNPQIERQTFLDTDGKAIRDAQVEIRAAQLAWENRLRNLGIHLKAEGRQPEQDPDYQKWFERLVQLKEDQALLNKKASDSFIAFVKFRLSSDGESEKAYRNKLKGALSEAEDLGTQYRQLEDFKNPYVKSATATSHGTNKRKENKTTRKGAEGQQEGAPRNLGILKIDGLKGTLHTERISSEKLLDRLKEFRKFEPQKPDVKLPGGSTSGGTKNPSKTIPNKRGFGDVDF